MVFLSGRGSCAERVNKKLQQVEKSYGQYAMHTWSRKFYRENATKTMKYPDIHMKADIMMEFVKRLEEFY